MKNDFDIERCLTSESKETPRQNYVAFISLKDKIYAASARYSIRQLWSVLHEKGKYKGSYSSFAYYFKKFKQTQTNEVSDKEIIEQKGKSFESVLVNKSQNRPMEVGIESHLASPDWNGKRPYCFEIPKDSEEEL